MAKSVSKSNKSSKDPIGNFFAGLFSVGRSRNGKNGSSDDDSDDNSQEQKAQEEAKQEAEKQVAEQSVKNNADIESTARAANRFVGSHDAAKATPAASDKTRQAARAQLQAREAAKAEVAAQVRDENARREAIEKTLLDANMTGDVTKEMAEHAAAGPRSTGAIQPDSTPQPIAPEIAAPTPRGQMKHGSRPLQANSDNQPLGPTRSQQAAYLGALNRERAQVGQKPLSTLDIIAGNGAMPTPKATDLSQLLQTRPVANGLKKMPVLTNPSQDVRQLTINDAYRENKKSFENSVQNAVRNTAVEVKDTILDPTALAELGLDLVEKHKEIPSIIRKASTRVGQALPVLSVGMGAYDGYKKIQPEDSRGEKTAKVLAGAAKSFDNALVGVVSGLATSPFASPVGGAAVGLMTERVYDKSGLNSAFDRGVDYIEPYIGAGIDFLTDDRVMGLLTPMGISKYMSTRRN